MNYLDGLNPEQKKAVLHKDGPILILAGAGAGKTKTITHRMLHLIHSGISPHNILAITFTNKAAKEMRERVLSMLDRTLYENSPFISTFHSLGVHIMREKCKELGIPKNFNIIDKDDAKRIIKKSITDLGHDPKTVEPAKIQAIISKEKGRGYNFNQFQDSEYGSFLGEIVIEVWKKYQRQLEEEKSFDFDDLLLIPTKFLEENSEARNYYNSTWPYVHIDEYQDTNEIQYKMSKLLSGQNQNVCAVGDMDQNIYSWRGAKLKNILNFEKDFKDTEIIKLEQNYRSTQNIITASNQIIAKNKIRKDKNLFTKNSEGERIKIFSAYNEAEEARQISQKVDELIKSGEEPKEIAVLYRANFQSRVLEEAFLNQNIPYQLIGTKFFERKEIKDILSFIKASRQPESFSDISRIINVPTRGIGKVTLLKIFNKEIDSLNSKMKEKVQDFFELLKNIENESQTKCPSKVIEFILRESGLEKRLKEGGEEDQDRLQNIYELQSLASKYDALDPELAMEKFLENSALSSDQDEVEEDKNSVFLMTVHASKGLEFDNVFISGLEQGLFPYDRKDKKQKEEEAEEERRLFYVALTRARKRIFLSYAHVRNMMGNSLVNIPSQFIDDIDADLKEELENDYFEDQDLDTRRKRGIDIIFD